MTWNWQQPDWPHFSYQTAALDKLEQQFLQHTGFMLGAYQHIAADEQFDLWIDVLSDEAVKTAEIEGEFLNRDSIQASLRRQFGLLVDHRRIPPQEQGMASLQVSLYYQFAQPLSHESLYDWHRLLVQDRQDLRDIGNYRTHEEPMQIVSGAIYDPKVHFEAPPSTMLSFEMDRFINWFNQSAPEGTLPLPALTRMALAHWYFVCIHPFEDGNGRIARALAMKSLSQSFGKPLLLAFSPVIEKHKKSYYQLLERSSRSNEITDYMLYFAKTVVEAQTHTQKMIDFIIVKAKFYDKFKACLNQRQEKVLACMFHQGYEGFEGGLSADKYIRIAKTSRATATRDLHELVEWQALTRTGALKSTRYFLNLPLS